MKLLVFGDTHGLTDFSHLLSKAREADVLLCVGDVTDFGFDIQEVAAGLASLARESGKPLIVTHGNHEEGDLASALAPFERVVYVHGRVHEHDGLLVYGFGGGGFRTHEPAVEEFLRQSHERFGSRDGVYVWLFHGPPHDTGTDVVPGLGPTGSVTKRELLEELRPHVVLVGHIHEAWGCVEDVSGVTVVNPGPEGLLLEVYSNTNSTSTSSSGASR